MNLDRRQQLRLIPAEFAFIQIEGDEGGRVLNVSEDGICFRAFSPICQTDSLRFWFSFNLRDRIDAVGRLAWLDATKKLGGIALTDQSHSARKQIRSWVRGVAEESKTRRAASIDESVSGDSVAVAREQNLINAPNYSVLSSAIWPSYKALSGGNSVSAAQVTSKSLNSRGLVPLQRHISATRSRFVWGVLLGVLASSAVAIPVFKYSNGQHHRAFQAESQRTGPEASGAPITSTPDFNPTATPPVLTPSTGTKPERSMPLNPDNPPFHASLAARRVQSPALHPQADGALSTDATATSETNRIKKPPTLQQLWSSVQAGNSKAAVTLATLYIHGDGVPVNCDQARVLLLVASERNNKEAISMLRDLDKTGCPTP